MFRGSLFVPIENVSMGLITSWYIGCAEDRSQYCSKILCMSSVGRASILSRSDMIQGSWRSMVYCGKYELGSSINDKDCCLELVS